MAGGAGAAGVGAYEAGKHHHVRSDPAATSAGITTGPSSTGNSNVYSSSAVDPRVDSTPRSGMTGTGNDHRYGRDAGVAGAGGLAAYEAEKHHHGRDESGRTSGLSGTTAGTTGRDYDSTRGSFVPGSDTQTSGGHHYGHDAGAGAVGGAEFSKHEAEKHRTEERHDESHEGKKQGGLFGFLHRDKNPKEHESTSHSSHGSHHGAEAAGVGAAGAGTAAHEYEKHDHDRNRLHKDAPKGYASQVTGGTGTTALAEGESVQRGPHASGLGNKLDPR